MAIAALSVMVSVVIYARSSSSSGQKLIFLVAMLALSVVTFHVNTPLYDDIFAKLQYKTNWLKKGPFKYVVENRSGLITVEQAKYGGDVIFGGGLWDGRFNIDPTIDINSIKRAYLVAALHRKPLDVLEIGLSSASWALVLDSYEPIESLDIVEINRGYSEVVRHYPNQRQIFESDKVNLHFDDGRRWLNRNPGRKFDLIVMNTTFHGRSNITNLLSEEFLKIIRSHLKSGGVMYYNTTRSEDVIFTAAQVYTHVVQYESFIAASDVPFDMSEQEVWINIQRFSKDPIRAMYQSRIHLPVFRSLAATQLIDIADNYRSRSDLVSISDDNMATEFRRVSPGGGVSWADFLTKLSRGQTR
jgi:hypothetical protein